MTFFGLGPWAIIHGIAKLAISQIGTLMTPFERPFSKLSENHKIFNVVSTEFELWHLKEAPNRAIICHFSALDHGLISMVSPNWQILKMNIDGTI